MLRSVALISPPPGSGDNLDPEIVRYRPPLGTLIIGDIFQKSGVSVELLDLSLEWATYVWKEDNTSDFIGFCKNSALILSKLNVEFYGFSTLAGSMPLSIQTALELRKLKQSAVIGLGGPGATAVSKSIVDSFNEIDFVFSGEAENALPLFIENFGTDSFLDCPNIVYKDRGGKIITNRTAPPFNQFITPNFKKWGYENIPFLPIEIGRGCPFSCAFCSTSKFFSRSYRLKETDVLLAEITQLISDNDSAGIEFTHDCFTVNKKKVLEICKQIKSLPFEISWTCSSRLNCYDDDLIVEMSNSGCIAIIFGIETASERMQKVINKNAPLENVMPAAIVCAENNITFTGSFIIGFPEESIDELGQTVNQYFDIYSVKGAAPIVAILCPLGNTEYFEKYSNVLEFRSNCSRLAFIGSQFCDRERSLVEDKPDVFPEYYSFPDLALSHEDLQLLEAFMSGTFQAVPHLIVGLRLMGFNGLEFALEWFDFTDKDELKAEGYKYYKRIDFIPEFAEFFCFKLNQTNISGIEFTFLNGLAAPYQPSKYILSNKPFLKSSNPKICHGACIVHSAVALSKLPLHINYASILQGNCINPTSYIHIISGSTYRVIELDRNVGSLLELCDGSNSHDYICAKMSELSKKFTEEVVCKMICKLEQNGFLV